MSETGVGRNSRGPTFERLYTDALPVVKTERRPPTQEFYTQPVLKLLQRQILGEQSSLLNPELNAADRQLAEDRLIAEAKRVFNADQFDQANLVEAYKYLQNLSEPDMVMESVVLKMLEQAFAKETGAKLSQLLVESKLTGVVYEFIKHSAFMAWMNQEISEEAEVAFWKRSIVIRLADQPVLLDKLSKLVGELPLVEQAENEFVEEIIHNFLGIMQRSQNLLEEIKLPEKGEITPEIVLKSVLEYFRYKPGSITTKLRRHLHFHEVVSASTSGLLLGLAVYLGINDVQTLESSYKLMETYVQNTASTDFLSDLKWASGQYWSESRERNMTIMFGMVVESFRHLIVAWHDHHTMKVTLTANGKLKAESHKPPTTKAGQAADLISELYYLSRSSKAFMTNFAIRRGKEQLDGYLNK